MSASRQWKVPLSDLRVDDDLVAAAETTLRSGWWSSGPRVEEFEAAFAAFLGAPHAVAVANGTAALHLALLAAECGPGDEVILPSLNFVAAANVCVRAGATPVFCDIRGDGDLNLDAADVEAAMTPATKAVLVLHYGGFPADIRKILDLAKSSGAAVIEDAAHAPGSTADGRMCGTFGIVGCFSFFANKNIPVGEGGMMVTADPDFDARLRLLRSHGMTTLTWDRDRGHASTYDVVRAGLNYRLDEVRAAIGLVQLARTRADNTARAAIAGRYGDAFRSVDGLTLAFADSVGNPAFAHHLAVVIADSADEAQRLRSHLTERRIQTSAHYPPIHRFSRYAELGRRRQLPRTDDVADRIVSLPLYAHMTDDQVNLVIDAVRSAYMR